MVAGRLHSPETGGRNQWLATLDGDRDHRGVDAVELTGCRERSREHVVEIDRAAELAEQAGAPVFCLGAFERSREVAHHRRHPCVELRRDLPELGVRCPARPASERENGDGEYRREERRSAGDDDRCHDDGGCGGELFAAGLL